MQPLHVRLEQDEAVNAKKDVLSSEINMINMLKKLNEYKKLRKEELKRKGELRTGLRQVEEKARVLLNELPKINVGEIKISKGRKESVKETSKKAGLDSELGEIRRKLEMLNK